MLFNALLSSNVCNHVGSLFAQIYLRSSLYSWEFFLAPYDSKLDAKKSRVTGLGLYPLHFLLHFVNFLLGSRLQDSSELWDVCGGLCQQSLFFWTPSASDYMSILN